MTGTKPLDERLEALRAKLKADLEAAQAAQVKALAQLEAVNVLLGEEHSNGAQVEIQLAATSPRERRPRPAKPRGPKLRHSAQGKRTASSRVWDVFQRHPGKALHTDRIRKLAKLPPSKGHAVGQACRNLFTQGFLENVGKGLYLYPGPNGR